MFIYKASCIKSETANLYKRISFGVLFRYLCKRIIFNNMTTVIIEDNSPQAKQLLEYIKTLPYATVVEEKTKSFAEAAEECNAVSVDEFFDELDRRIEQWSDDTVLLAE